MNAPPARFFVLSALLAIIAMGQFLRIPLVIPEIPALFIPRISITDILARASLDPFWILLAGWAILMIAVVLPKQPVRRSNALGTKQDRMVVVPLGVDELRRRLSAHVYTLYMNYAFLIKSGVFAVAALSLYHIFADQQFDIVLPIFWLASFSFAIVTISTWTRGAALANAHATFYDVLIPILISVPEYLLFIAIDPTYANKSFFNMSAPWTIWYLNLFVACFRRVRTRQQSIYANKRRNGFYAGISAACTGSCRLDAQGSLRRLRCYANFIFDLFLKHTVRSYATLQCFLLDNCETGTCIYRARNCDFWTCSHADGPLSVRCHGTV